MAAKPRLRADERLRAVLQAAAREFALGGLHGTSAEVIARRAGISQPYLFRLFGTKKELFLAVVEEGFDRVLDALRTAAASSSNGALLDEMERAYAEALTDDFAPVDQLLTPYG